MSGKEFFDTTAAADILSIYIPVIGAMKLLVGEIYHIYENADCNKELYLIMVDQIKEYTKSVSKLKGYKRFPHAIDVKNAFEQLRNDFDRCIDDSNAIDRKEEFQRVDKSLKEVKEGFNDKLVMTFSDKVDAGKRDLKKHDCFV
ncbi:hypothetical protein F8M41_022725 [Gigaspora margarita]|uniref:Uncharacterized protein n=1 Tax=Gigaspora margarita TaxID=4874 RepID=A0A8H4AEK7_GIGMA|nr:hypothetical protein F8M41_022725 [Gigaspora margarita]